MFSCRQATRLVSEGLDHPLTLWQRILLAGHMIICIACRTYRRQVVMLDALVRQHVRRQVERERATENATEQEPTKESDSLSPEALARIKASLQRKMSDDR